MDKSVSLSLTTDQYIYFNLYMMFRPYTELNFNFHVLSESCKKKACWACLHYCIITQENEHKQHAGSL